MLKKKTETEETGLDVVNDRLTSMTSKVQDNKKLITICSLAVVAVVVVVLAYVYFFRGPGITKANDAIGAADLAYAQGNDSIALAQYMQVADDFGYDAGNRAALQAAAILYEKGEYQKALDYVDKGDCYVNLDKLSEAVSAYKDAISQSDDNPAYTPYFMLKLARVYAAQNNHADEADLYKKVLTQYPTYGQANNIDVEKLYDRARLQAEAK